MTMLHRMSKSRAVARLARWSGASVLALALVGASVLTPLATTANGQSGELRISSSSAGNQRLKLGLNKSVVVDLPADAYDILVANPTVADAVTRTARRIYLFGKQVGETNIFVFGANGEQIVSLDLAVERDVSGLQEYLKRFIPDSQIEVELLNDNVVLSGTVQTPLDAARAAQLAQVFVTGGEATTGQYSQTASGGGESSGVDIDNPDQERRTSQIVNLLKVIGEDQVTLKVTVAEVSRNVMKQLSVNLLANNTSNGISWGLVGETVAGLGKSISGSGGSFDSGLLDAYFNAMEQSGVMKTLAEPTLTAVSGEKATFRVGGEFNLITGQAIDDDTGAITYETERLEYGIGLEFQPVVLSPGRISLKIRTQVSEPTNEGSVQLGVGGRRGSTNLLSIRRRLADTTVELPSGGSMMIAGLVRDDIRQTASGLPGLSKIPVLGALFRSRDFVRNETELVIIVTPYMTRPVARNDLARPDDNFNPAHDGAAMLLGRINRVYGTAETSKPNGRYHGVVGFIYK
jgi:pilus assembly protein CpaC